MKTVKLISKSLLLAGLAFVLICSGCKKESSEKKILEFWVNPLTSSSYVVIIKDLIDIDEIKKTISLKIPDTYDITALYVGYRLSDNASGSLMWHEKYDLSKPTTFTVTAENGSTDTYTIIITTVETQVISIEFNKLNPPVEGIFRKDTYYDFFDVTVPFYTDMTKIVPTIVVSEGAKAYYKEGDSDDLNILANDVQWDITRDSRYSMRVFAISDENDWYSHLYIIQFIVLPLKIDQTNKTSIIPGEKLTLNGYFASSENTVTLKRGQTVWNTPILSQNVENITIKTPGLLTAGQYTLAVASHGVAAEYSSRISVTIPTGVPWITELDKTEYHTGDQLVITGNNFLNETAYIDFVPIFGGVTVRKNIQISSNTATLNAIPTELLSNTEYEISIYFSVGDVWTNEYPVKLIHP